jgi:hypothetical protein
MAGEATFVFRLCNSEARAANHWIAGAGACKAVKAEAMAFGHSRARVRSAQRTAFRVSHKTRIAMAPHALLSCQCAFYLWRRAC